MEAIHNKQATPATRTSLLIRDSTMDRESLWNLRFHQLAEYKRAHGHCNPSQKDGNELGRWVAKQRAQKRRNTLNAEREATLNAIGFVWNVRCITMSRAGLSKTAWDTRFDQLEKYKEANGDCNVSRRDRQNIELGRWVAGQRQAKKTFLLSEEREAKLSSIGFAWSIISNKVDWNVRFEQLVEYKEAVGDLNVPLKICRNPQLGRWVQLQRLENKRNALTNERWEKLNSIGFDWGKQPSGWIARNQQLEKHKRTHRVLCDNVPERCSGNNPPHVNKLATAQQLVYNRRKEVRETESVAELKTTHNDNWGVHFMELLSYLQTHGDFNVPQCYPRNPLLARWVSEQRNIYDLKRCGEQTSLTPLREAKLDAIGFPWFVGGTEEDAPAECVSSASVRSEEARSGNKVRSENNGVASPDSITSG
jgi:hypothetical protein